MNDLGTITALRSSAAPWLRRLGARVVLVAFAGLAAAAALLIAPPPSPDHNRADALAAVLVIGTCKWIAFELFRLPRVRWNQFGLPDAVAVTLANTGGALLAAASWSTLLAGRPAANLLWLDWLHCQILLCAVLAGARLLAEKRRHRETPADKSTILIYGAGNSGTALLRQIQAGRRTGYRVVGFIDDDPAKLYQSVRMTAVLGTGNDVPHLVRLLGIEELLVAIPRLSEARRNQLRLYAEVAGATIKFASPGRDATMPEVSSVNSTDPHAGEIEISLTEEPFQDSIRNLAHALHSHGSPHETPVTDRQAQRAPVTKPNSR